MTPMEALLRGMQRGIFTDHEMTDLPVIGESPWGFEDNPAGVWAWSQDDNQVIIGEWREDFRIVTYEEAWDIYGLPEP